MHPVLPIVYLPRHGETEWTISGQHTGLIDLPLTLNGERNARKLGEPLRADGVVERLRAVGADVSIESSPLQAWVVPTNEELLIARDTGRCVVGQPHPS